MRHVLALAFVAALVLVPASAHADPPTTWLAFGLGLTLQHDSLDKRSTGEVAFAPEFGVGTPSTHPIVIGAVLRTSTYIALGTDVSLSFRIATAGFTRGELGAAFDIGVLARWWDHGEYGHFPLQTIGIIGLPGPLQFELGAQFWDVTGDSPKSEAGIALITVDIFRWATKVAGAQRGIWSGPRPELRIIEHDVAH